MKTKHLFYAAGIAAMMAACANEDIVLDAPQLPVDGARATVEGVQLYFGAGVDSRLTFDGTDGYAWEATDTIGALLMDQPGCMSNADDWTKAYKLVDYVNTSYPFTYNADNRTWGTLGKMLEGNYFFAFPWSSYDGARAVKHSLFNQQQTGVAGKAVAQSYADNQFFIGYAKIKAGTQANETLEDVEMTDVLGAIQLRMVNNSGNELHIYKVVLEGQAVNGELTFTPDTYSYDSDEDFNYLKYIGKTPYSDPTKLNRADALRAVVKENADNNVAQLIINGTDAERAVAKGATAYALIMAAPMTEAEITALAENTNEAKISVFTDEGVFTEAVDLRGATNIDGTPVKSIKPGVSTTLQVNLQTMSALNSIDVYTEKDLKQLINWNAKANTATPLTATIKTDLVLTKEVFDLLKSNSQLSLKLLGAKKLTLAADLPSNVLDFTKLTIATTGGVEVLGAINWTKSSEVGSNALTIAEGAAMTINENVGGTNEAVLPTTLNKGTLTIGAVKISGAENITNEEKGTVNVAAEADVKATTGKMTNKGILNLNGYMNGVINGVAALENDPAVINLGEGATIEVVDNYAAINAAKNSTVSGANKEANSIVTVVDTTVDVSVGSTGMVAVEYQGEVAKDAYKSTGINTLILKSGETKFKDAETGGISNIIAKDGAKIVAADGVKLALTSIEVNGAVEVATTTTGESTVLSNIKAGAAIVKKGATLTVNGEFLVTTTWTNEGLVINNDVVKLPTAAAVAAPGNWKYKKPTQYVADHTHTTAVGQTVTYSDEQYVNLEEAIRTAQTEDGDGCGEPGANGHVNANEYVKVLKLINSTVDMTAAATTAKKTNADYIAALAKEVILNNGTIKNLAPSMNVDMAKLTVAKWGQIAGTKKTAIAKVDELIVEEYATLDIVDGYLEIDVTAQKGFGCQYITIKEGASINGEIVAKDANSNYLYWDANLGEWIDTPANNATNVTLSASAKVEDLRTLLANENVRVVEVASPLSVTGEEVIDLNGKTVFPKDAGSRATTATGLVFDVAEGGKLTLKNGNVGKGDEDGNSSTYQIVNNGRLIMQYVNVYGAVSNVGDLEMYECYVETNAENQNALVSGYNNIDANCNLILKDCILKSSKHAAAKLQNNNAENSGDGETGGEYSVEGTVFEGAANVEDLCLASANVTWGSGNKLKNNKVLLFDEFTSLVNGKKTKKGSLMCGWEEIYPEETEK